jgi:hypothetical protein
MFTLVRTSAKPTPVAKAGTQTAPPRQEVQRKHLDEKIFYTEFLKIHQI